jgi:hypothetical protein
VTKLALQALLAAVLLRAPAAASEPVKPAGPAAATPAAPAEPSKTEAPKKPKPAEVGRCQADLHKLCNDQPKKMAAFVCLFKHRKKLAPACKKELASRQKRGRAKRMAACGADQQKYCADAKKGRMRDCLRAHAVDLSKACRGFLLADAPLGKLGKPAPARKTQTP